MSTSTDSINQPTNLQAPSIPTNDNTSSILGSNSKSNYSAEFVESLTNRIQSLLPNRTNHTLAEVELNPQYLITKKLILKNCKKNIRGESNNNSTDSANLGAQLIVNENVEKSNIKSDLDDIEIVSNDSNESSKTEDIEFITNVFISLSHLLDSINNDDFDSSNEFDEKSLSSILLILRLLTDLIKHIWNQNQKIIKTVEVQDHSKTYQNDLSDDHTMKNNNSDSNSTTSSSSDSKSDEYDTVNFGRSDINTLKFLIVKPPSSLDPNQIENILDILSSLLSSKYIRKIVSLIKRTPFEKYHIGDTTSSTNATSSINTSNTSTTEKIDPNHDLPSLTQSVNPNTATGQADLQSVSSDEINFYIDEIDNNLEMIFKFLASSNPIQFYQFLNIRVISYAKLGENIPLPILQKFVPLYKYVFFNDQIANSLVSDVYNALPFIKSNTWKQVLLTFFTDGIKDQHFARPGDYDSFVKPYSKLDVTLRNLFDYISTIFEDSPNSGVASSIQSLILILCVGDFLELDSKPNKLRIAFNKRLKYVTSILRDSNNCSNLECFESLINIFHMAAILPPELHAHPLYKFVLLHLDETYENLNKLVICFNSDEASILYDDLVVKFYIAAILIKPQTYLDVIETKFHENKDKIKEVRILVKLIKGLADLPITRNPFLQLMDRLSNHLKSMIFGAFKILYQNEQNLKLNNNEIFSGGSSSISIHSDKYSMDSDQKSRYFNQIANKKTSLDHYLNELNNQNSKIYPESNYINHQTDDLLAKTVTKNNNNNNTTSNASVAQQTLSSNGSSTYSSKQRLIYQTEEIMGDIFSIFITCPEKFFHDFSFYKDLDFINDKSSTIKTLTNLAHEIAGPIKFAVHAKSLNENSNLFDSACSLALTLVESDSMIIQQRKANKNDETNKLSDYDYLIYSKFLISNFIIEAVADSSLQFHLTDPKFKSCFLFLNRFLQSRDKFVGKVMSNQIIQSDCSHSDCFAVCQGMEKVLLLVLCTHDIQFYSIAKTTMKWHIHELKYGNHLPHCFYENLGETFEKIIDDNSVFTGFVSLHKRFRNILRDAKPTKSLYHVWLVIYFRWLELLDNKFGVGDDSLVFRHFTGFLVSISGAFLKEEFAKDDSDVKYRAKNFVSEFLDKCISLLTSTDLVVRVVVKDALSNESHSAVYHLICTKLIQGGNEYLENKVITDESILYIEQCIVIITAMIMVDNDGAFVLVSLLPGVCEFFIRFIMLVPNPVDILRLKLRFCKLGSAIETDKFRVGLSGAFRLRNFYAKASADWLEQAVFYDEMNHGKDKEKDSNDSDSIISPSSSSLKSNRESEIAYLNIDLANDCSKALAMQLEDIVLEIPDGTKDKDIRKYKDLAFGNYFSLFYKILQKYAVSNLSPNLAKSKYKIGLITDNVLKCISNILQFDTDIGMQFVLPLGYHENKKIRSIFLVVFANMLKSRKIKEELEEFPDEIIERLSDLYDVFGATAEVASSSEHNLLASSLFGIFSYTKKLDKLFTVLLNDEINVVSRSTDIFRRNSTLTRLLSNFAKDYGLDYLSVTLQPFLEELIQNEISFEVEKANDPIQTELFMKYFTKLIDVIIGSTHLVPPSFEYICSEIYNSVKLKFKDAALVAVGSFIFLRFFCPAIISPETFFKLSGSSSKVKRSLMQLVKVVQNMANGSLALLKWPGLIHKSDELNELNRKIFVFLENVSTKKSINDDYPFQSIDTKPIAELRYLHKFLYTYFIYIKHQYVLTDPLVNISNLHERVENFRTLDRLLRVMGQPKALISLQISNSFRNFDPNGNVNHGPFNEFMAKMSTKNHEVPIDSPVVHNFIFQDGTPVAVINFGNLKYVNYDVDLLVFKLLEICSQIWDNNFYMVFDFTGFTYVKNLGEKYVTLLSTYAPSIFHKKCKRTYYFNIPRLEYISILKSMRKLRLENNDSPPKIYTYSQVDEPEIINSLGLDDQTTGISKDTRVVFKNVKLYDEEKGRFQKVTLKIGRQWLQVCSDFVEFSGPLFATNGFYPVEVLKLSDITKCETTNISGEVDEFTIYVNIGSGHKVTLKSSERPEILRFLYFTTSRLPKQQSLERNREGGDTEEAGTKYHWFARLHNIAFHGLLESDPEVRSCASYLFATLSKYFDFDFGISPDHAKNVCYPIDTTEFIVGVSDHLSKSLGPLTYRFLKAFFNNYEKLKPEHRLSAIMYISPWVGNVCDNIYLDTNDSGIEKVSEIIRQFCRITAAEGEHVTSMNELVWKKFFGESRLTKILIEEVIAFAVDNKKTGPEWASIISIIAPSVEVCGEVTSRLIQAVGNAKVTDSVIASQSKLLEILILVKICSSLFFNSYVYSHLYLADVFFVCTLFIDNPSLEFGSDLQNLVINTIQSFLHKPAVTPEEEKKISETINYFSSQRARMLFGVNRERSAVADASQIYNRAASFEILCDYLNEFISCVGSADDRFRWRSRWCSRAVDVVFQTKSMFQNRAVLVFGILSKNGISDSASTRLFKMMGKHDNISLEYITNLTVSVARIFEGVSSQSIYPPYMLLIYTCNAMMHFSALYQPNAECITNIYCKLMKQGPNYRESVFKARSTLEPLVSEFENTHDIFLTNDNFEFQIFHCLIQGLKVAHFRQTSMNCLKKVFETRLKEQRSDFEKDNITVLYLFFIYLFSSQDAFEKYLAELELSAYISHHSKKSKTPKIFTAFVSSDSEISKLCLVQAAYLFNEDNVDHAFKNKFLDFFSYLFKKKKQLSFLIYHITKPTFEQLLISSNSLDTVSNISELLTKIFNDSQYDPEISVQQEADLLFKNDLLNIREIKSFLPQSEYYNEQSVHDLIALKDMILRAAYSFVEGYRLED